MSAARVLLWLVGVVAVLVAFSLTTPEGFQDRRPRATVADRPAASGRAALPAISSRDPAVQVDIPLQQFSSTGTAFAFVGDGHWVSARHVVDGCDRLLLEPVRGGRLPVVEGFAHGAADLALIRTKSRAPTLSAGFDGLQIGQPGFHYGFPTGKPGAAASLLLGRRWMRVTGAMRFTAPVIVWSEVERAPDTLGQLGGMSGGPVLDPRGRVVGVTVAASQRRGRIYSAAPASMRELIDMMDRDRGDVPETAAHGTISIDNFVDYAVSLLDRRQVARVRCRVDRAAG